MAGNIKQVVERIRNKIPFNKGISRMPVNSLPGFLGDMQNFEYSDGTVKNRMGSRVINFMSDNLWYHIETFQICGVNVTLGLNYKRELWAWLPQWPETDFRVCNSSPFRTYRHTSSETGISQYQYTRHFSFTQGNKFWMKEDAQTVIMFSDYGEIFRIMKNGFFRITADEDYADQKEAVQDIRDDFNATTGRLYLDIKEATNKVFDERMYIGDEYIRRSHRITGETRFAWVNELNVISELSDPIDIEGYKHVVVSINNVLNYRKADKTIPIKRTVTIGSVVSENCKFYNGTEAGTEVCANAGETWLPINPYTGVTDASMFIMEIDSLGKWYNTSGDMQEIDPGIYACIVLKSTGEPIALDDSEWNFNVVDIPLKSPDLFVRDGGSIINVPSPWKDQRKKYKAVRGSSPFYSVRKINRAINFAVVRINFYGGEFQRFLTNYKTGGAQVFQGNIEIDATTTKWIKLSEVSDVAFSSSSTAWQITEVNKTPTESPHLFGFGKLYSADIKINYDDSGITTKYGWNNSNIVGYEVEFDSSQIYSQFANKGYDCWDFLKSGELSIGTIDLKKMRARINGIESDADAVLLSTKTPDSRFALWNNSHIQGISQRCFVSGGEIVYEGLSQPVTDNLNNIINGVMPEIDYTPLMTLDYTGLRRIPMPLPLIRRAMRNPQHIALSGGYVYSIEDGKVWYGSVNDCMMVDSLEVNASIYQIAEFDSGLILATNKGLAFVDVGSPVKSVVRGETIIPRFIAPCSGGVIAIEGRDIYIIYKHITDSGAWYPSAIKINPTASEINLEGELKTVSIGKYIYLADDWNLWIYNIDEKMWCGRFNYGSRIHRLFVFNGKLAISFDSGLDRKLAFDRPRTEQK